jgi:hypothetical protein
LVWAVTAWSTRKGRLGALKYMAVTRSLLCISKARQALQLFTSSTVLLCTMGCPAQLLHASSPAVTVPKHLCLNIFVIPSKLFELTNRANHEALYKISEFIRRVFGAARFGPDWMGERQVGTPTLALRRADPCPHLGRRGPAETGGSIRPPSPPCPLTRPTPTGPPPPAPPQTSFLSSSPDSFQISSSVPPPPDPLQLCPIIPPPPPTLKSESRPLYQ